MKRMLPYVPALLLGAGALLLLGVDRQHAMTLRGPLSEVPTVIMGYQGADRSVSKEEQQVAGMDSFLFREYRTGTSAPAFSVYVGYYEQQTQGRTIHSPRNCLPGAGWEPLAVSDREISLGTGVVKLRRYLLAKGPDKALVYYWYQGRGRISSNEYKVKWELLRDAALRGRSEEALVRIVLPLQGSEAAVDSLAAATARILIPAIEHSLPEYPNRRISGLALSILE